MHTTPCHIYVCFSVQPARTVEEVDETDGFVDYLKQLREKLGIEIGLKVRYQYAINRMRKKATVAEMAAIALESTWFRRSRFENVFKIRFNDILFSYPAVVAEWANESIQIQVGLLRRSQVRIPLEDVYMAKMIKHPKN